MVRLAIDFEHPSRTWWEKGGQELWDGITEGFDGAFVDFRPTNTFEGVAGCAQTRPRESSTQCPSPKPACD